MILEWLTKNRRWVIAGCAIVILFTILVEVFSSYSWAESILSYFQHWSLALGAGATLALAYIAYISILENRRIQETNRIEERDRLASARIRDWAEMIINALGTPTKEILFEKKKSEETMKIQPGLSKTVGILYDAERLDSTLNNRVKDAVFLLQKYDARLMGKEQIEEWKDKLKLQEEIEPIKSLEEMRDSIMELLTALSDVINSATDELVPKR